MASAAIPQARLLLLLETDPRGAPDATEAFALSLGCQAPAPARGQPQTLPWGREVVSGPRQGTGCPNAVCWGGGGRAPHVLEVPYF